MQRNVQIWRMVDGLGSPLPARFPSQAFVSMILAVQAEDEGDLRAFSADGTELLLEAFASSKPHVCLHRIRRDNLPSEEQAGRVQDLSIPETSGLAEGTHIVFYPRNIVAVIYNHSGPRIARMSDWLAQRVGLSIQFQPVHRTDIAAVIKDMVRFNGVELSLTADQAAALLSDDSADGEAQEDGVAEALYAVSKLTHLGNITIRLSVGPGKPSAQKQSAFKTLVNRIVGRDDLGSFRKARVTGVKSDGATTVVDLIEDRLVTQQDVEAEQSRFRRVSTESAFQAANGTFELFKKQISEVVPKIDAVRLDLPDELAAVQEPSDGDDSID